MSVALRKALRAFLLDDAAVYAAVIGSDRARIFPARLPQNETRPSVVFQEITSTDEYHFEGSTGLVQSRMQIVCWALNQEAASHLADLVKSRLSAASGDWAYGDASPQLYVRVQGCFAEGSDDVVDDVAKLYGERRDFMIHFEEV